MVRVELGRHDPLHRFEDARGLGHIRHDDVSAHGVDARADRAQVQVMNGMHAWDRQQLAFDDARDQGRDFRTPEAQCTFVGIRWLSPRVLCLRSRHSQREHDESGDEGMIAGVRHLQSHG